MRRIFHNEEDRKLANRWLVMVVAVYSAAAVMIVLISALLPLPSNAGLEALRGPVPGFHKDGLHSRSQTYTTAGQAGAGSFRTPMSVTP